VEHISMYQRQLQILGEVALAMLLGAVLGLEREIAHKPAGLRTHMMVAGAAALLWHQAISSCVTSTSKWVRPSCSQIPCASSKQSPPA
jgi:uncharacterized membrane protein YhiD involved in acid resistance